MSILSKTVFVVFSFIFLTYNAQQVKTITVPNVLTPNGDNKNDKLTIIHNFETSDIATFQMYIYDRFGKVVYRIYNINSAWDGKDINGRSILNGTYFYVLSLEISSGQTIEKEGTISVFDSK